MNVSIMSETQIWRLATWVDRRTDGLQRAVGPLRPLQAKDWHGDEGLPQEAHPVESAY